jgi:hypothetical protein
MTPELFGIPVAVLALAVASLGFVISLFALSWQIAKHLLDGGRVKVQLNAAAWEPSFMLTVERSGRWRLNPDNQTSPEHIEVAQLVVENPGRTAVTVYSPGIAVSGHVKKNHRISPRMFPLPDYGPDAAVTDTVVRIEPYDRVTFILDYWSIVPRMKELAGNRAITLRGVVEVAGKSKPRRSSWHRRWRIGHHEWTAFRGDEPPSPRTVMFRPLYVSAYVDEPFKKGGMNRGMLGSILSAAMNQFDERPPQETFKTAMVEAAKAHGVEHPVLGVAVWNMFEALDQRAARLGPWVREPVAGGYGDSDIETNDVHTKSERTKEPGISHEGID